MTGGRVITVEERTAWASSQEWRERARRAEKRETEVRDLADVSGMRIAAVRAVHWRHGDECKHCQQAYPCATARALEVTE